MTTIPHLTAPTIELVISMTDPATRRVVAVEPVIRLRAFTNTPSGSARYADLTEQQLIDLILSGVQALQEIHKNGA